MPSLTRRRLAIVASLSGLALALAVGATAAVPGRGLARAQAMVAQLTKHPTSVGVTKPVGKPIPTGKRVVVFNCGIPQCTLIANSVTEAGKTLGWNVQSVNAGLTPESINKAWTSVAANPPDGIVATGYPRVLFAKALAKLNAAKVPVAECCVANEKIGGGIRLVANDPQQGAMMADWVVADTKGKANVLFVDSTDFPIIHGFKLTFTSELRRTCPSCKLSSINVPTTSFGTTLPNQLVGYLRSHRDVNYLALGNDGMATGLPQALRAARLDVPFIGDAAEVVNLSYVKNGQERATIQYPLREMSWRMIDALARIYTGQSVKPDNAPMPFLLLTKDNIQHEDISNYVVVVKDYKQQYRKLWGK